MSVLTNQKCLLAGSVASFVLASMMYVPSAHAIVPNDDTNSEEIVDTDGDFDGVGQFFRADGFVCTGTLINPRTVLFAAHCVNNVPAEAFGTFIPAAFSFNVDALPGLQNWFANGFQSNAELGVFNVSQIVYDPRSLQNPQAQGFIEADIALATLDTPAANIPTWALLFSALPATELSTQTGTGYHVDMVGYGGTGNAFEGSVEGIDFRRRAVENYLGALASLDDRNQFLFGAPAGLPQNLYMTDFDDPSFRGFPDFNLFLDDPLPNEGTTAGGDSGGPLILGAENNEITDLDVIIGVLSGGSRFFQGQPGSTYGTSSFYQPLYAYWEYIAGANPYHYVGTQVGDGNWEDASHWVSMLDPNYYVIDADGAVVNGIPDTPEEGLNATGGDFGAVCFQPNPAVAGTCQDLSTGEFFQSDQPPAASDDTSGIGVVDAALPGAVDLAVINGSLPGNVDIDFNLEALDVPASDTVANSGATGELAAPTIANGLPGATDFVPNNVDPDPLNGIGGSYYDVTLSQSGTTTLSSAVTIDRLTVNGGMDTRLNIASGGSLTSLIDVEQVAGMVNVDGTLTSVGDYLLMTGILSGSGTVAAPFVTNVMGAISPGTNMGEIATLTIDGSAVLSSASTLIVDIDTDRVNDVLAITGSSSLGGQVVFNPTANVRAGNSYTFLTTGGTQSGAFSTSDLSAILTPVLTYGDNSVTAVIEARSVLEVIDPSNASQAAYGQLLDGARSVNALGGVFASFDFLATAGDVQSVLNSWAPTTETTLQSISKASTDELGRIHRDRMDGFSSADWGGRVTVMGNPVLLASNSANLDALSGATLMAAAEGTGEVRQTASIPEDYEIFLSGGFMDGNSQALNVPGDDAEEDFDGWSVSGGIEHRVSDKVSVGASMTYMHTETDGAVDYNAENRYIGGALYGQLRTNNKFVLDGVVSLGSIGAQTSRVVTVPGAGALTVTSDDDSLAFSSELMVSRPMDFDGFVLAPRASLRNTVIQYEDVTERGSAIALDIDRSSFESVQARLGFKASSDESDVKFALTGDFVNELATIEDQFTAGFVGLNTGDALFPLISADKDWFEFGVSLGFDVNNSRIALSADTTAGRSDLEAQSYRASVSYKF